MLTKVARLSATVTRELTASEVEHTVSAENLDNFKRIVAGIKQVAPKSEEFLYFVCRAIHAMEAANLDPKTGALVGDGLVDPQTGLWKSANGRTQLPYVNQNGDAFPEAELLKIIEAAHDGKPDKLAYQSFIGRGLFVNHASDDAEKIRGIILDATWDPKTKGVDLLVACDRVAYPELARQIQAGYSNNVSMGTQVQESVCSVCGNHAKVEADYCAHVKTAKGSYFSGRPVYETNIGLNFIEISVVATGADPKAKIRQVLAHLNQVITKRSQQLAGKDEKQYVAAAETDLNRIKSALSKLASAKEYDDATLTSLGIDLPAEAQTISTSASTHTQDVFAELNAVQQQLSALQNQISEIKGAAMSTKEPVKAYLTDAGQGELNTTEQNKSEFKQNHTKVRDSQDKHMVGKGMEPGSDGMAGDDAKIKERLLRAELDERRTKREALLKSVAYLTDEGQGDLNTTEQKKPEFKQNYTKVRDGQDKQMVGKGMESGSDGLAGDDLKVKENLLRAGLKAILTKHATDKKQYSWTIKAGNDVLLTATAEQLYGDQLFAASAEDKLKTNFDWVASKDFGHNLMAACRQLGIEGVKAQIKAASTVKAEEKKEEKAEEKKEEKKNEPPFPAKDGAAATIASAKNKQVKAQTAPGAMALDAPPAIPPAEAGAPKVEDDKKDEGVDVNINVGDDAGGEKEAGAGIPADVKNSLQEVADDLSSTSEQLASILGGEQGDLGEEAAKEGKDIGGDVVEAGEEVNKLDELDKALSEAGAPAEGKPEDKTEAIASLKKIVVEAVADARKVVAAAKVFIAKVKKPIEAKSDLATRKAARQALAEKAKLYPAMPEGDMLQKEAHPKGNTTAVPGHEIKTETGKHEADVKTVEKCPTGKLTAAQQARRDKVVAFTRSAMEETKGTDGKPAFKAENPEEEKKLKEEAAKKAAGGAPAAVTAAADKEAKSYYGELFNSDPEAKKFAADLAKDYAAKSAKAAVDTTKGIMHRAYKLALRQAKLGMITSTHEAIVAQVNTLTEMDDKAFSAFEKAVEQSKTKVEAGSTGRSVTAGLQSIDQGEKPVVVQKAAVDSLRDQLASVGWSDRGRRG